MLDWALPRRRKDSFIHGLGLHASEVLAGAPPLGTARARLGTAESFGRKSAETASTPSQSESIGNGKSRGRRRSFVDASTPSPSESGSSGVPPVPVQQQPPPAQPPLLPPQQPLPAAATTSPPPQRLIVPMGTGSRYRNAPKAPTVASDEDLGHDTRGPRIISAQPQQRGRGGFGRASRVWTGLTRGGNGHGGASDTSSESDFAIPDAEALEAEDLLNHEPPRWTTNASVVAARQATLSAILACAVYAAENEEKEVERELQRGLEKCNSVTWNTMPVGDVMSCRATSSWLIIVRNH